MRKLMMTAMVALALGFFSPSSAVAQIKPGGSPGTITAGCVHVIATSVEAPHTARRQRFSAQKTTDILLNAVFTGRIKGEHLLSIKLFTPHGYLYRQYDVPVAANSGRAPQDRKVEHYPYPVKEKFPQQNTIDGQRLQVVTIHFPVAGSNIVTNSLYGAWSVEVLMDGESQTCQDQGRFFISE